MTTKNNPIQEKKETSSSYTEKENLASRYLLLSHRCLPKNMSELCLLGLIVQSPEKELRSGEIAAQLGLKTSQVAAMLKNLENKEEIYRHEEKSDRRKIVVGLTEKGWESFLQGKEEVDHHIRRIEEELGDQSPLFFTMLKKVITLEEELKNA